MSSVLAYLARHGTADRSCDVTAGCGRGRCFTVNPTGCTVEGVRVTARSTAPTHGTAGRCMTDLQTYIISLHIPQRFTLHIAEWRQGNLGELSKEESTTTINYQPQMLLASRLLSIVYKILSSPFEVMNMNGSSDQ